MKLKCPGCSQVLNVPDTAAGQVVKCPCGKALRAPAAKPAVSKAAPALQPAAPQTLAPQPTARQPVSAQPTAAPAGGPAFAGEFDLTESDLEPVRGVSRPGEKKDAPKSNENALLKKFTKEDGGWEDSIEGSHPAGLKSMGGWNFIYAIAVAALVLVSIGFTSMLPLPPQLAAAKGIAIAIIGISGGLDALFLAVAGVCCFLPHKSCWFYLLFSNAFGVMIALAIFISSFMYESSIVWKLITFAMVFSSFLSSAYLHSDDVRKFYETTKISKKYVIMFDGIGVLIGGMLMVVILLLFKG